MANLISRLTLQLNDRITRPMQKLAGRLDGFNQRIKSMAASSPILPAASLRNMAAGFVGYQALTRGIGGTVGAAMKFQSVMTEIAKKTTLSPAGLEKMRESIIRISNATPVARDELGKLVAMAGQFGIASADLERFAMLGAKAATAFDMSGAETGTLLSQVKNAYQLNMDGLTKLADAINYVADSAGASEKDLIDILLRSGATAKTFGLGAQDVLAFGASLREVGIESSIVGTSMKAILTKMSGLASNKKAVKALDAIAGKGYSRKLQQKFYEAPVEALTTFFELTKSLGAEQRSGLLTDFLGLEYGDDGAAIAENVDKIIDRLKALANESNYVGSVDRAFALTSADADAALKRLWNNISRISTGFGSTLLPAIADFANAASDRLGRIGRANDTVVTRIGAAWRGLAEGLGLGETDMFRGVREQFQAFDEFLFGRQLDSDAGPAEIAKATKRAEGVIQRITNQSRDLGAALSGIMGGDMSKLSELGAALGKIVDGLGVLGTGAAIAGIEVLKRLGAAVFALSIRLLFSPLGRLVVLAEGITAIADAVSGAQGIGDFFDRLASQPWWKIAAGIVAVGWSIRALGRAVGGMKRIGGLFSAGVGGKAGGNGKGPKVPTPQEKATAPSSPSPTPEGKPAAPRGPRVGRGAVRVGAGAVGALGAIGLWDQVQEIAKGAQANRSADEGKLVGAVHTLGQGLIGAINSLLGKFQDSPPRDWQSEWASGAIQRDVVNLKAPTSPEALAEAEARAERILTLSREIAAIQSVASTARGMRPTEEQKASLEAARSELEGLLVGAEDSLRQKVDLFIGILLDGGGQTSAAAQAMAEEIRNGIAEGMAGAVSEAQSGALRIIGAFDGLSGRLFVSGATAVSQLAAGMRSRAGEVNAASTQLAQAVANKFPASPAKEGPLRELPLMGRKIVEQLAGGMRSGPASAAATGIAASIAAAFPAHAVQAPPAALSEIVAGIRGLSPEQRTEQEPVLRAVPVQRDGGQPRSSAGSGPTIYATFHISSTDPRSAAAEVLRALDFRSGSALEDIGATGS
ncbi:phage tail tape measure protein [Acuticoccus sp. M5D2P5]|uniref:phage tail tape measure protein n=1 Tax=Acuticoccus kalidii TaxID=2910977 RepID=UPI001F3C886C|nr:phage tail tape measure protein [Acuticoccus kalidii]MCF3934996.1 phage tail tape measure protein [Acuticoccus kalidii]